MHNDEGNLNQNILLIFYFDSGEQAFNSKCIWLGFPCLLRLNPPLPLVYITGEYAKIRIRIAGEGGVEWKE